MVVSWKNKFNRKHGFPKDKSHSIAEIARLSKISVSQARKIVEKGKAAYFNNPQSVRPQVKSATHWGLSRLYSSVGGGPAAKVDKNELKKGREQFKKQKK
jgi:hypothetical protein